MLWSLFNYFIDSLWREHTAFIFEVGLTIKEDQWVSLGKRYLTAAITSRATQRADKHLKERYCRGLERFFLLFSSTRNAS